MTSPTLNQPAAAQRDPLLDPSDTFARRHLGPSESDVDAMLKTLGFDTLDALTDAVVPESIRLDKPLTLTGLPRAGAEHETLTRLRKIAERNQVQRSFIGCGYHGTITPPVILRNVLESPGWYTQYTPYQPEISQGRLEALLNFQTMVADLTGLPLANSSLLDEVTAAAEAMSMALSITRKKKSGFFVAADCHPQTINVIKTRAEPIDVNVHVGDPFEADFEADDLFAVLVQYPATDGRIVDYSELVKKAHDAGAMVICAADLLALTLIEPPGEWGADIVIGSAQRFGVPMGAGGPHAAYMATHQKHARRMPGRIVGVSVDAEGNPAYRLAIQTREQHIKRDRATSNICTAQVLLAIMASMYGAYHGPDGLKQIARRVHRLTRILAEGYRRIFEKADVPVKLTPDAFFDTITLEMASRECVEHSLRNAAERGMNLRDYGDTRLGITFDETTTMDDVRILWSLAEGQFDEAEESEIIEACADESIANRQSPFMQHPAFHQYHAEHEMLRYLHRLQSKDLSLTSSMIPLGSCTMKLNATSEMLPITWPEFANIHPYAPVEQQQGYRKLYDDLETWLAEITGFAAVSLQPNAGSQGEYAGLLAIRAYHADAERSEASGNPRDICLIPTSAHGTNPASAVMAGFKVVSVACDQQGNIDVDDLRAKSKQNEAQLGALMITYPSTHGVFEPDVRTVIDTVHQHGGLVYMDGANMNAQVGLTSPGEIGADVCHLNLHKTFCIPHGGGGPGMGPIGVNEKLAPYLPAHPLGTQGSGTRDQGSGDNSQSAIRNPKSLGPVSAAPFGSPAILPISWMYIAMMGAEGLTRATQVAILNANYMAKRLRDHYNVLYTGPGGLCAHEFILDCCDLPKTAKVSVEDIAKRLMDFGFHAPTMSFPVAGTLMVEPTESEARVELDRFCDAMIKIREEITAIENGELDAEDNPLHGAPHTAAGVSADDWPHKYPRSQAAYPVESLRVWKYWPPVARIDNPYGDRNLMCTCPPVSEY